MTAHAAQGTPSSNGPASYRQLLLSYLLRYRWRYVLGLVAVLASSFLVMLPPIVLRRAIDAIEAGAGGRRLAGYGALVLLLAAGESALGYAARHLVSGTSRRLEYELRNDLAAHYLRLDLGFYLRSSTGDLMARCTNDLQIVRNVLGPTMVDGTRSVVLLVVGIAFMLTVDVRLTLIVVIYLPIVLGLIVVSQSAAERRYLAMQAQFSDLTSRVQENISGIRTIKAYAQEETEIATFSRDNQEMVRRAVSWSVLTAALWPLMTLSVGASTVLLLWYGGQDVASGRLSIGAFVQFNAYLAILARPLYMAGWVVIDMQQGIGSLKRIAEVLYTPPAITERATPAGFSGPVRGEIAFEDVTFGYGDTPVLRDFTLTVPAGATVAIVGATGAGKTTIVNLLARLYDPWQGRVTLDGVDLRDLPVETPRALIGVVPQESFLFSETVRDNIAYGRAGAPSHEIDRSVAISRFEADLPQLPQGLDTMVGERGATLSGGQKQRAALARALLKDAPVLVLDDALSHVDTHTEEEILRGLRAVMRERTTIVIAHRTSTLLAADTLVVLQGGAIVEQGTHAELLEHGGPYARLYRRQLLAEQVEDDRIPARAGEGAAG